MTENLSNDKSLKRTLPFSFRISTRHGPPLAEDRAGPLSVVLPSTLKAKSASPPVDAVPVKFTIPELTLVALSTGKFIHPLAMVFSLVKGPFVFIAV